MRVLYFTEQPYPDAWSAPDQSLRVTLPSEYCDPTVLNRLYARYHDEWMLADELGFDLMVNEHHSTPTCLSVSGNISLGILARITKKARLLALGVPISNRTDPLRVAEELAMIDVISGGRLEMGFVRGVPYEASTSVYGTHRMMDRLWEAHDFIIKAMTTHDGPFQFSGEFFHYRNVNVWPRPLQEPHPPVWITASSPRSMAAVAERGHVAATFLGGYETRTQFDAYRDAWKATHGGYAPADRLAYTGLCAVGRDADEVARRADHMVAALKINSRVGAPYRNPPGYLPVKDNVRVLKSGSMSRPVKNRRGESVDLSKASLADYVDAGLIFAGTPDEVYEQIRTFHVAMGGFSNLILMLQAASMSHDDTAGNLSLFAKEVLPRLRELPERYDATESRETFHA